MWFWRRHRFTKEERKKQLQKVFFKQVLETRTGRIVDLRCPTWDHNITRTYNGFTVWCTPRLQNGDVILTKHGRFIAYGVKPGWNAEDMVIAKFINELRLKHLEG